MSVDSIDAYTPRERVSRYDRDMSIMHPNRDAMVQTVVDALPFDRDTRCDILDLGIGTGVLADALLDAYPNIQVFGVDGAESMLESARERLAHHNGRVNFITGDFRNLARILPNDFAPIAAVSAFALHHVPQDEKEAMVRSVIDLLPPDGWFLNADIVLAEDAEIEARWQTMRVAGIVERAAAHLDARFKDTNTTRLFLDTMEATEGDCPQTLTLELATMHNAGLHHAGVFWQYTREAVYGGYKSD